MTNPRLVSWNPSDSTAMLAMFAMRVRRFSGALRYLLAGLIALTGMVTGAWAGSMPQCQPGFALTAGMCRGAPTVCPAGTSLQAGVCTGMPGCPAGSKVEDGLCTQTPGCAPGYNLNRKSGTCTTSPVCAGSAKFDAELGRCVESAQCIPSIAGRRCSCPTGGEYREAGQLCVQGPPACPPGSVFDTSSRACQ